MLKVNNRKTINHLVINNLREYKLRNLFTVITITLSVGLIAGLSLFSAAILEMEQKDLTHNPFADNPTYNIREIFSVSLVGMVILFISVFVIHSIFYISVSERIRQFGQLRTIGMTKKQVKRMVRKEGTILSLFGGAIGIGIGASFAYILKPQGFNIIVFIIVCIVILTANYITVQLAVRKPAKLAADISPIEACRISGYELSNGKNRTNKLKRKLSPLSLSMIAVKGNRKKSTMTMISLCLAGIVFQCSASFLASIDKDAFSRQSWFRLGDFVIELSSDAAKRNKHGETGIKKDNPISQELITKVSKLDGVKDVISIEDLSVEYSYNGVSEKDLVVPFTKEDGALIENCIKEGSIDYDRMVRNKEILIIHNNIAKEIFGWTFQYGDRVTLRWFNGEKEVHETYTIGGILNNSGKLYQNKELFKLAYGAGWFLLPKELVTQMMTPNFNLISRIIISSDNQKDDMENKINNEVKLIIDNNPLLRLSTHKEEKKQSKEEYNMIYATFLGGAFFVIAFSVINLLNTLISSAMARRREFAYLGAIGASNRQIRIMIMGEGLYFAVINLVVSALPGTVLGYAFVRMMIWSGLIYLDYQFPVLYLVGYGAFVLAVPILLSMVIVKIISRRSLVDRLRELE